MVNVNWSMKIVSGGQTGADRAALDFAIRKGIDFGGWIPKGRRAEDGPVPESYAALKETNSDQYQERTRLNIEDSDGTMIISHGPLSGGALLTLKIAENLDKPNLHLDLGMQSYEEAAAQAGKWIVANRIGILNVAGPRASGDRLIYDSTKDLLTIIFE